MKQASSNPHVGTRFEDFLRAEGRLDEATTLAIKRVLAYQLTQAMTKAKVSQAELARRMGTSRAVIRRLLDKDDPSVTLSTMTRAASALGKSLTLKLAA
jgi:antitoxin HicB